jgi:hypothetical protein
VDIEKCPQAKKKRCGRRGDTVGFLFTLICLLGNLTVLLSMGKPGMPVFVTGSVIAALAMIGTLVAARCGREGE